RPLHPCPVASIDLRAAANLVAAVTAKSGPVAARNARDSLIGYWNWLTGEGLVSSLNPFAFTNQPPTSPGRDRVPTLEELHEIWSALGTGNYADIVKLLVYTGWRKTEIGGLTWQEVDLTAREIRLPGDRTKNRWPHVVPLVPQTLAILQARPRDGTHVFGSGQRGFAAWAWCRAALDTRIAA